MKCKGLIFDLDGTLLDTLDDLATAANNTLKYYSFPEHPVDAYRYFVGEGLKTLMQRIIPESKTEDKQLQEYMGKFAEIYSQNWNVHSAPYTGILEMIQTLANAELQLAILSNKPQQFTKLCVETFFPAGSFMSVVGQRDGVPKKPDPTSAIEIAKKMNLLEDEIIYVGDTATDMQTGNRAGMRTIGVEWGFRDKTELQQHNAWKIAATPSEVISYAI